MITNPDGHQNIVPTSANCNSQQSTYPNIEDITPPRLIKSTVNAKKKPTRRSSRFSKTTKRSPPANTSLFRARRRVHIETQLPPQTNFALLQASPNVQIAIRRPRRDEPRSTAVYIISNGLGQSLFARPVRLHTFLTGSTNRRVDNRSITKLAHSDSRGTDKFTWTLQD